MSFLTKINDYIVTKLLNINPKYPRIVDIKENAAKYEYKLRNGLFIRIGVDRRTNTVFLDFMDDKKGYDILGIMDLPKLKDMFNTMFYVFTNYNISPSSIQFSSIDDRRINLYVGILRRNLPNVEFTVVKFDTYTKIRFDY